MIDKQYYQDILDWVEKLDYKPILLFAPEATFKWMREYLRPENLFCIFNKGICFIKIENYLIFSNIDNIKINSHDLLMDTFKKAMEEYESQEVQ